VFCRWRCASTSRAVYYFQLRVRCWWKLWGHILDYTAVLLMGLQHQRRVEVDGGDEERGPQTRRGKRQGRL